MADPSPDESGEGRKPDAETGQTPEQGEGATDAPDERGRSYPEAYVKQLRREASGYRTRLAELEERLQEREDADKSEQQKLAERVATAETRLREAEGRLLRYEVASERGLDLAAVPFLSGTTREEIELRAEELEKLLNEKAAAAKPAAGFDGGARLPAPEKRTPEEEHNKLLLQALRRP